MAIRRLSKASITSGAKSSKMWDQETSLGFYESIATVTSTGSVNSVTFSNIPQNYTHLQVRALTRCAGASTQQSILIYPNSDGAADKTIHRLYGTGASAASQGFTSQTFWIASGIPCGNDTANVFGASIIDILDYRNTSKNRVMRALSGSDANGSGEIHLLSGLWVSTVAISSLLIASGTGNLVANSTISLYGIRG